jgi:hypothetical protein
MKATDKTLAIFLHGTGRERSDRHSLKKNVKRGVQAFYREDMIRYFSKLSEGIDLSDFYIDRTYVSRKKLNLTYEDLYSSEQHILVLDGPGAKAHLPKIYKHMMPGDFDIGSMHNPISLGKSSFWGKITGAGWDENVAYALAIIERTYDQIPNGKRYLARINMLGWSRGGVTALMLANALSRHPKFKNVEVNIMAADPVNGPVGLEPDHYTLPPNVKNFSAIIKSTAANFGFSPLHKSQLRVLNPQVTQVEYFFMYGNHSMTADFVLDKSGNTIVEDPALVLCYDFAYKFLQKNGTEFSPIAKKQIALTPQEKLNCYAKVMMNRAHYQKQGKVIYNRRSQEYLTGVAANFVNKEHQDLERQRCAPWGAEGA